MDKKTFKALERIMDYMEETYGSALDKDIEQVLVWMDEVESKIN